MGAKNSTTDGPEALPSPRASQPLQTQRPTTYFPRAAPTASVVPSPSSNPYPNPRVAYTQGSSSVALGAKNRTTNAGEVLPCSHASQPQQTQRPATYFPRAAPTAHVLASPSSNPYPNPRVAYTQGSSSNGLGAKNITTESPEALPNPRASQPQQTQRPTTYFPKATPSAPVAASSSSNPYPNLRVERTEESASNALSAQSSKPDALEASPFPRASQSHQSHTTNYPSPTPSAPVASPSYDPLGVACTKGSSNDLFSTVQLPESPCKPPAAKYGASEEEKNLPEGSDITHTSGTESISPEREHRDTWSPSNPNGRKQYDREFLLRMQTQHLSLIKPKVLVDLSLSRDSWLRTILRSSSPHCHVPSSTKNEQKPDAKDTVVGHTVARFAEAFASKVEAKERMPFAVFSQNFKSEEDFFPVYVVDGKLTIRLTEKNLALERIALQHSLIALSILHQAIAQFSSDPRSLDAFSFGETLTEHQKMVLDVYSDHTHTDSWEDKLMPLITHFPNVFKRTSNTATLRKEGIILLHLYTRQVLVAVVANLVREETETFEAIWSYVYKQCSLTHLQCEGELRVLSLHALRTFLENYRDLFVFLNDGRSLAELQGLLNCSEYEEGNVFDKYVAYSPFSFKEHRDSITKVLHIESCLGEVVYVTYEKVFIWWRECTLNLTSSKVNTLVYTEKLNLSIGDIVTFSSKVYTNAGFIRAEDVHVHVNITAFEKKPTVCHEQGGLLDEKRRDRWKIKQIVEDYASHQKTVFYDCCGVVAYVGKMEDIIFCTANENVPCNLLVRVTSQKSWIIGTDCLQNTLKLGDYVVCDIESSKTNARNLTWIARCVRKCDAPSMVITDLKQLFFSDELKLMILNAKTNVDEKILTCQEPYWNQAREALAGNVMWDLEGEVLDNQVIKVLVLVHVKTRCSKIFLAKLTPSCWNPNDVNLTATGTKVIICASFQSPTGVWIVNRVRKMTEPTPNDGDGSKLSNAECSSFVSNSSFDNSKEQKKKIKCPPTSQEDLIIESCVGEVIFVTSKKANIWWYSFLQANTIKPNMLVYANSRSIHKLCKVPKCNLLTDYLKLGDIITFSSRLVFDGEFFQWVARNLRVRRGMLESNERGTIPNVPSPNELCQARTSIKMAIDKMSRGEKTVFWNCCGVVIHVNKSGTCFILCLANEDLPYKVFPCLTKGKSWIVGNSKILTCGEVVVCDIECVKNRSMRIVWEARCVRKCSNFSFTTDDNFMHLVSEAVFNTNLSLNVIALSAKENVDKKVRTSQESYWDKETPAVEGNVMWNGTGEIAGDGRINLTAKYGVLIAADISEACWNPDKVDLAAMTEKVQAFAEFEKTTRKWIVYCVRKVSCPTLAVASIDKKEQVSSAKMSSSGSNSLLESREKQTLETTKPMTQTENTCVERNPFIKSCVGEVIYVSSKKANIWWYAVLWDSRKPNMLVYANINCFSKKRKFPMTDYLKLGNIVIFSLKVVTVGGPFCWEAQDLRVLASNVLPLDKLCLARSNVKVVIEELKLSKSTVFWDCSGVVVHADKSGTCFIWCPANENVPYNFFARVTKENSWIVGSGKQLTCGETVVCDVESITAKSRNLLWQARCVRKGTNKSFLPDSDFRQLVLDAGLNPTFALNVAALHAKTLVEEKVLACQEPYWDEIREPSGGSVMWNATGEILACKSVKTYTKNGKLIMTLISPNCWNPDKLDFSESTSKVVISAEYNGSLWFVNCVRKLKPHATVSNNKEESIANDRSQDMRIANTVTNSPPRCDMKQYIVENCVGEVIHIESKSATIWWHSHASHMDSSTLGVLVHATINSIIATCKDPTSLLVKDYLKIGDLITFSSELNIHGGGLFRWVAAGMRPHGCSECLNLSHTYLVDEIHPCKSSVKHSIVHLGTILWDCCGIVVYYEGDCGTIWCPEDGKVPCSLFVRVSKGRSWIVGRDQQLTCGEVVVCDVQIMKASTGNLKWLARCVRKSNTLHASSGTDFQQFVLDNVLNRNVKLDSIKRIVDEQMKVFQELIADQDKEVGERKIMWNAVGETVDGKQIKIISKHGSLIVAEISGNCWNPDNINLTTKDQQVVACAELRSGPTQDLWIVNLVRKFPPPIGTFSEMTATNSPNEVELDKNKFASVVPNVSLKSNESMVFSPPLGSTCIEPRENVRSEYKIKSCIGKVIYVMKPKVIIWWYASSTDSTRANTLVFANRNSVYEQSRGPAILALNTYFSTGDVVTFSCELLAQRDHIRWKTQEVRKIDLPCQFYEHRSSFEMFIEDMKCGSTVFWDCTGVVVHVATSCGTIWCSANENLPYNFLVPVTKGMSWIVGAKRHLNFDKALACGDRVVCDIEILKAVKTKKIIFLTRRVRKSSTSSESMETDFQQLLFDAALNRNIELNLMTRNVKTIVDERIQTYQEPYWDQLREFPVVEGKVMWSVLGEIVEGRRVKVTTKHGEVIVTKLSQNCWNPDGVNLAEISGRVVVCAEFNTWWVVHCVRKLSFSCTTLPTEMKYKFPELTLPFLPTKQHCVRNKNIKPSVAAKSVSELRGLLNQHNECSTLPEKTDPEIVSITKEATDTPRFKSVECQTVSTGTIISFNLISD